MEVTLFALERSAVEVNHVNTGCDELKVTILHGIK
jgi:hypothetical protein